MDMPNITPRQAKMAAFAAAGLLIVYSTAFRVDSTENAVVTTLSKISSVAGPGLNFKVPFIQGASLYPTNLLTLEIVQKRPPCGQPDTANTGSGNTTYTKDQQFLYASTTAQYNLLAGESLKTIHSDYQNYETVLNSYLNQAMKAVLGGYNTTEIPEHRSEISEKIRVAFVDQIQKKGLPVEVGGVQFNNFDFSCQYEAQVEHAAEAKTELTRMETELATERVKKDRTIVTAEAEKQKATLEGDGEGARIFAKAKAEAEGVELMQTALSKGPLIVEYAKVQKWNGATPVNMYSGAPVPFIDVYGPNVPGGRSALPTTQPVQAAPR